MSSLDTFPLDPDFAVRADLVSGVLRSPALSLRRRGRRVAPSQRVFTLPFRGRSTDEVEQIRDWIARFEDSYFVFNHKVWVNNAGVYLPRKFPVVYLDDTLPQGALESNEVYDFDLRLLEAAGEALAGNYLQWPNDLANAAWTKGECSVLATKVEGPDDVFAAQRVTPNGGATNATLDQDLSASMPSLAGRAIEWRVWLMALTAGFNLDMLLLNAAQTVTYAAQTKALTTSWQEFSVPVTLPATADSLRAFIGGNGTWVVGEGAIQVYKPRLIYTALDSYPQFDAGHPTRFLEEDAGKALGGTWTRAANSSAHGSPDRFHSTNANANTTDAFQFSYAGYGFRLWSLLASNRGIFRVYLDGVDLGTVDLYNGSTVASLPVFEKREVPLGLHRVKIEATNSKNPNSSANTIQADALEYIY